MLGALLTGTGEGTVIAAGPMSQVNGRGIGGTAADPGQAVAARPDRDDSGTGLAQHDIQPGIIAAGGQR